MNFQSEHVPNPFTLVATAVLVAGDPVTPAGAVAADATDFVGIAMSDAAIGEAVPIAGLGAIVNVVVAALSAGVTAGDRIVYSVDGYDTAVGNGFAFALDDGVASGYVRIVLMHASAA